MSQEPDAPGARLGGVEAELSAIESTVKQDAASVERLRALLEEGYLQNLLNRIETLKTEVADATRSAERAHLEVEGLRARLLEEEERLVKLWDAYKSQEDELRGTLARADRAEREALEAKTAQETAELVRKQRERDLADAESQLGVLQDRLAEFEAAKGELAEVAALRARVADLERQNAEEKQRLAKLYAVFEETEAERDRLRKELTEREAWFEENKEAFDQLIRSIRRRTIPVPPPKKEP